MRRSPPGLPGLADFIVGPVSLSSRELSADSQIGEVVHVSWLEFYEML